MENRGREKGKTVDFLSLSLISTLVHKHDRGELLRARGMLRRKGLLGSTREAKGEA